MADPAAPGRVLDRSGVAQTRPVTAHCWFGGAMSTLSNWRMSNWSFPIAAWRADLRRLAASLWRAGADQASRRADWLRGCRSSWPAVSRDAAARAQLVAGQPQRAGCGRADAATRWHRGRPGATGARGLGLDDPASREPRDRTELPDRRFPAARPVRRRLAERRHRPGRRARADHDRNVGSHARRGHAAFLGDGATGRSRRAGWAGSAASARPQRLDGPAGLRLERGRTAEAARRRAARLQAAPPQAAPPQAAQHRTGARTGVRLVLRRVRDGR